MAQLIASIMAKDSSWMSEYSYHGTSCTFVVVPSSVQYIAVIRYVLLYFERVSFIYVQNTKGAPMGTYLVGILNTKADIMGAYLVLYPAVVPQRGTTKTTKEDIAGQSKVPS